MRRMVYSLAIVAIALIAAAPAWSYNGSYVPGAGINNTPHDLGTNGKNGMFYGAVPADPLTRICIYCHAPHNTYRLSPANGGPAANIGAGPQAADAYTYLPLWNHTLPNPVPTYITYQNGPGAPSTGPKSLNASPLGQPGNVSLLCLSCHDGVIAVNSYGNSAQPIQSQSNGSATMASGYQVGKDYYLGNHHPITFDYDNVRAADPEIRNPDFAMMTVNSTVRDHLFGDGNGNTTYLECASCHSVHNKGNTGERLLWRSDQNSELCLTCHDKGLYTAP